MDLLIAPTMHVHCSFFREAVNEDGYAMMTLAPGPMPHARRRRRRQQPGGGRFCSERGTLSRAAAA